MSASVPPSVSALLPSYNHARYVAAAIESVLAQTWTDFELVITDDGSSDESPEIISRYLGDGRIVFQRHANAGISANFNRGANAAHGQYVAYLGSDDRWHPEHLARAVQALDGRPEAGWYYARAELVDRDDRPVALEHPLWGDRFPQGDVLDALILHGQSFIPFITTVFRASHWPRRPPFDPRLIGLQDYDLFLQLAERSPIVFSDTIDAYHRWDGRNTSTPSDEGRTRFHIERLRILDGLSERLANQPGRRVEARHARHQRRSARRHAAHHLLRQGRPLEALPLLQSALRDQPLWLEGWVKLLGAWWARRRRGEEWMLR